MSTSIAVSAPLVFITGASSGIGQALALRYYQAGYRLALVARRGELLTQWAELQGWPHERWAVYAADVSDTASITAAGRDCLVRQGLPEVVIANAGISRGMDTAIAADLEVMRATLLTNVLGLAATFQPFVAPMTAQGRGTLVTVASVAGIRGLPGHGAYCASKAAAIAYSESLRGDLRASGVGVVTICPGYIDTPLTKKNRFPMPFLMPVQAFAESAFQAIAAGGSYHVIPRPMGWVARLLRLLPNALFDRVFAHQPRKQRGEA